jgi:hypothetical protein
MIFRLSRCTPSLSVRARKSCNSENYDTRKRIGIIDGVLSAEYLSDTGKLFAVAI